MNSTYHKQLKQNEGKGSFTKSLSRIAQAMLNKIIKLEDENKKLKREIAALKKEKEKYFVKANTDGLTKIYNKDFVNDNFDLEEDLFAFIDLSFFKPLNDKYGHVIGDKALIEIADHLTKLFPDYTVARYGGDEFVIVAKSDKNTLLEFDKKMFEETLSKNNEYSFKLNKKDTHKIGLNYGIAVGLKQADKKMYDEKNKNPEARLALYNEIMASNNEIMVSHNEIIVS